ncbi:hypothetical protein [Candidatus Absconditicoccus praedator]|uniref:hypothetical protein n=1 Tax=Candidatus Absconditicoccus praedator TaxID=2735562 RepID=UPI001E65602D|nr:hypothetical protein [Candidatus Absconditicoccus praedator]UFX83436.1 hypothetical protein HLG78_04885 [Candidatus Absconditicoccus praedator]
MKSNIMPNPILLESYNKISEDNKLIRLATVTTIIYSIIFVVYVIYQLYYIVSEGAAQAETMDIAFEYIQFFMDNIQFAGVIVTLIITLAVGYFLLPPIADGALISYLNNPEKGGKSSIGKGLLNFFPMFEYNSMMSVVNYLIFFIAVTRLWDMGILENTFVQVVILIWAFIIFFSTIFFHYSKFLIIIEGYGPVDAIKKSIALTLENFGITLKFVLMNYFLYIRFLLNIVIIVIIPWIFIWIFYTLGIDDIQIIQYSMYIIFGILILLTAYINGIIEAFFTTYWYKVYKTITKNEDSQDKDSKETSKDEDTITQQNTNTQDNEENI